MTAIIKTGLKVNQGGTYADIIPETYADMVHSNGNRESTVRSELNDFRTKLNNVQTTANAAAVLIISEVAPSAPTYNMIWVKP